MNEIAALELTAVRVIETADAEHQAWSDADRAWASHAAAAAVGEAASAELFLLRRAHCALDRLHTRHAGLRAGIRALRWQPWVSAVVVLVAFLIGLLADRLGDSQHINVLAPPVLILLLWNLTVYLVIAITWMLPSGRRPFADSLRSALVGMGSWWKRGRGRVDLPFGSWLVGLSVEWGRVAAPLYQARAARVLHLAAAALGAGVIIGLYLRGVAFEYRASWESTFLDSSSVHALLTVALAPGAWLGGLSLPELAQVDAIRAPGSENAAPWLHLLALSLVSLVVLPRLALAALAWLVEQRRARGLVMQIEQPYFRRLLRAFHVQPTLVAVLPYGYTPSEPALAGLEAILARVLGGVPQLQVGAPVAYGEEDDPVLRKLPAQPGPAVLLFNLAATPEREAHACFAQAVAKDASNAHALLVLVDETSLVQRVGDDPQRLEQRRAAWRDILVSTGLTPVFVHLAKPDLTAADTALDQALNTARN